MGLFSVTVRLAVATAPRKWASIPAIVDAGATFSIFPAAWLKAQGVRAVRSERFELANGRNARMRIGEAILKVDGVGATCPVVFGRGRTSLLGATALEILGFKVNPKTRRLEKQRTLGLYRHA